MSVASGQTKPRGCEEGLDGVDVPARLWSGGRATLESLVAPCRKEAVMLVGQ